MTDINRNHVKGGPQGGKRSPCDIDNMTLVKMITRYKLRSKVKFKLARNAEIIM